MLVKDLIGAELDYWCAKAAVIDFVMWKGRAALETEFDPEAHCNDTCWKTYKNYRYFMPSEDWSQAGPLIHEYGLSILQITDELWESEYSYTTDDATVDFKAIYGETPLVAAMRALVASVFGDEVESIKED